MTKNMYGINNKSNGVVRMYVTTSVTHKPEVRIDLLLEPYSKLCSFHNLFANRNVFPCVSKRPIVHGVVDLQKFNYEDLEEIVAGGQGSFGV